MASANMEREEGPFQTGQLIGGAYRVGPRLNAGGPSYVYLAADTTVHTPVAIKTPGRRFRDSPLQQESFIREAKSWFLLDHPNIAQILAILDDASTNHRPVIVMKYYE